MMRLTCNFMILGVVSYLQRDVEILDFVAFRGRMGGDNFYDS